MPTRREAVKDIAVSVVFAVIAGVFYGQLSDIPQQAAKYPAYIIYLIFALCFLLLAKAVARFAGSPARVASPPSVEPEASGEEPLRYGLPTVLVVVISFVDV
ncbi:MAG: hypothetical protein LIP77_01010, partial [Planctomycetes bacterium]|nr:hypothetical protein [Planctomycetota bacterium]